MPGAGELRDPDYGVAQFSTKLRSLTSGPITIGIGGAYAHRSPIGRHIGTAAIPLTGRRPVHKCLEFAYASLATLS